MSKPERVMGQFRKGESFSAQGDDGRIHLVSTWVEYVDEAEGRAGRPQWEPSGFECLRVEDGRAVQALSDTRYEVASSGIVLQRIASVVESDVRTESVPENAFTSEGGYVAGTRTSESGPPASATESACLMPEYGVTRSGRFFLCRGYRYSKLEDAVAYARLLQIGPAPLREDDQADMAQRAEEPTELRSADDERLMASWGISFADGQYVFEAFRYDRLADALAYARLERSSFAT